MRTHLLILSLLTTALCGCRSLPRPTATLPTKAIPPLTDAEREHLVEAARSALGQSQLSIGARKFRADCSGTIRAIFAKAGVKLGGILKSDTDNDVKLLYRYIKKYGQILKNSPKPGDLVFFHNTYDRSRNGRLNDALTHVGIVEEVAGSTVSFIHHLGKSVIRSRMDLSQPSDYHHPDHQNRINHMLRKPVGRHPAYTAAQLFAGFGRL